jgi:hypothetical protein
MEPCKKCLVSEYRVLASRIHRIREEMRTREFENSHPEDRKLMVEQYEGMVKYRVALRNRIARMGIIIDQT